jgi:hypothetical protein
MLDVRALLVFPLLLLLGACSSLERSEPAAPVTSEFAIVTREAQPSPSAAPSASAAPSEESIAADEPEPATPPEPGACSLPAERPSSFGVKQLQHMMPHGRPDSWAGGELTTKTNVCPREPKAHVVPACTTISDAQMDQVYRALVKGRFCSLRHHSPPRRSSPHYGSRSITVYIGERSFEVSDSSGDLLDEASKKRFYEIADVIINTGLAAAKPVP